MSVELLGRAVDACEALTQTVEKEHQRITEQVNLAIQQLGNNKVNLYVEPGTGNDNNSGSNIASAFRTFNKALSVACSPALQGAIITIFLNTDYEYFIDNDHEVIQRVLVVSARGSSKVNINQLGRVVNTSKAYFGTFGFRLYNSALKFVNARIKTPLFSEVEGHDRILTSATGGLLHPVSLSTKLIEFTNCELFAGDQYILVPSPGDFTFASFANTEISLRDNRSENRKPISINSSLMTANFYGVTLHNDLEIREGSLFEGILFRNGNPINLITNASVMEAIV